MSRFGTDSINSNRLEKVRKHTVKDRGRKWGTRFGFGDSCEIRTIVHLGRVIETCNRCPEYVSAGEMVEVDGAWLNWLLHFST